MQASHYTRNELVNMCRLNHLGTSGRKQDLVDRLNAFNQSKTTAAAAVVAAAENTSSNSAYDSDSDSKKTSEYEELKEKYENLETKYEKLLDNFHELVDIVEKLTKKHYCKECMTEIDKSRTTCSSCSEPCYNSDCYCDYHPW